MTRQTTGVLYTTYTEELSSDIGTRLNTTVYNDTKKDIRDEDDLPWHVICSGTQDEAFLSRDHIVDTDSEVNNCVHTQREKPSILKPFVLRFP